jgi:hypothetical protein
MSPGQWRLPWPWVMNFIVVVVGTDPAAEVEKLTITSSKRQPGMNWNGSASSW